MLLVFFKAYLFLGIYESKCCIEKNEMSINITNRYDIVTDNKHINENIKLILVIDVLCQYL